MVHTPDPWTAAAALLDSSRRALYDAVRRAGRPVARDEAAATTGMSRGLAAFHLDKLVDAGLLTARYEAPGDRPRGRGRTPKVYEATGDGVTVTVPERRYQLIAEILAAAVDDDPAHADAAASRHAHQRGHDLGAACAAGGAALPEALTGLGYEPEAAGGEVLLRNCPFHALAGAHTALICGLNQAFLAGLLTGMRVTDRQAVLAPDPGRCCVALTGTGGGTG
ncbi:helix-turn-helix transcriptional regulator [Actinoplanes aureus]|uniref:Helix-turn-helix domain-containing protein n=1 Tax=Actinoplanes aureus TaxID=2792083 RepID=A0A931FXZ3_9ACTN|nr:helix-turn-helix domain-containing protein [Actinoplanes aureus]MBG0564058.1 helix-turn-helix domain-containing protein [Actinoplanes aureus]